LLLEKEVPMAIPSLLAKGVLEPMLNTARKNLARDGFLMPVLFVAVPDSRHGIVPLALPQTAEQKQRYFAHLGFLFRRSGQTVSAAAMLSESWFVNPQTAPAALKLMPSQHPCRQEAVVLIGRNAGNTRSTHVVQPFARDRHNRPVWGKDLIAVYNEPVQTAGKSLGLLDYLFLANRR
jgi:hypothetical protein